MDNEFIELFSKHKLDDEIAREYIEILFEGYKSKEKTYEKGGDFIPHNIIGLYYYYINKQHVKIIYDKYKELYIFNESRIEDNATLEEQEGIGEVYDYISSYDFSKNKFNIFLESMRIHQLLYSKCFEKSFGGGLRTGSALLYNSDVEVVPAEEAIKEFNTYILNSDKIMQELDETDIFHYIEKCIIMTTNFIRIQPFPDGNKRTFRALLNLMLKKKNLPPIYVTIEEKNIYKQFLIQAMHEDYDQLIQFYYYKICDSIVNLDIKYEEDYQINR